MEDPAVNESDPTTEGTPSETKDTTKDMETATAVSEESAGGEKAPLTAGPIVSTSKRTRPSYKFDPDKITLRFLFANRDGLTVTIECNPTDTVGEVKGSLMSVWPEGLPECEGGDQIRLVCMGKGYLMPDERTLGDCEIPVFKTHPTPINVSLKPETKKEEDKTVKKKDSGSTANSRGTGRPAADGTTNQETVDQGCTCVLL